MPPYACSTRGSLLEQIQCRPDIDREGAARFLELLPEDRWPTRVGTDSEGCLEMIWDSHAPAFANVCVTQHQMVCCYARDATGVELFVDESGNEASVCVLLGMLTHFPPSSARPPHRSG